MWTLNTAAMKKAIQVRTRAFSGLLLLKLGRYAADLISSPRVFTNRTDCLVHGPLTATLLLHLIASAARETSGQVQRFEYRATSPLTVEQTIRLRGAWESADQKEASLWALNEVGTVCMTAKATLF